MVNADFKPPSSNTAYVEVSLYDSSHMALADSGASVTIISHKIIPREVLNNLEVTQIQVSGVTGTELRVLGTTNITLNFAGQIKISHSVLIVDGMNEAIILGRDILIPHQCILNYAALTFEIKGVILPLLKVNNKSKSKTTLFTVAARTHKIPPNGQITLPCRLISHIKKKRIFLTMSGIIEPNEKALLKKYNILGVHGLTNFIKGTGYCKLINTNNFDVYIYKNQKLGDIFAINKESIFYNEIPKESTQSISPDRVAWETDIDELYRKLDFQSLSHLDEEQITKAKALIYKYRSIFSQSENDLGCTNIAKHTIILDSSLPIRTKHRPIPHAQKEPAEKLIKKLMDAKIIRHSNSPYHSPAFLIKKPNGTWRLVCDFRMVNKHVIRSQNPLPSLDSVTSSWANCTLYSRMDFASGYFQTELAEESKAITACSIPSVCFFEFNRVPLGLSSAVGFFQGIIEKMLLGLKNSKCICFLDDIATASITFEEMLLNLELVFERIISSKLLLKPEKCRFFQQEMDFLGYKLSHKGIQVNPSKTAAISKMMAPKSKKGVKAFVGMCSFYRKFIKGFAEISRPLTNLMKKDVRFKWGNQEQIAFETLKTKLLTPPILAHPDLKKPFTLTTDASDFCIAAVLAQKGDDGHLHPVAYASNILSKTQQRWSSFQREFFALKFYCQKFRDFLLNTKFTVRTDHQALVNWRTFHEVSRPVLWRWFLTLSQFDFEVVHIRGKDNDSDGPSRLPRSDDLNLEHLERAESVQQVDETHETSSSVEQEHGNISSPSDEISPQDSELPPIVPSKVDNNHPEVQCHDETMRLEQEKDELLQIVRGWVQNKKRPPLQKLQQLTPELKTYYSSFNRLRMYKGILYRSWDRLNGEKPNDLICVPRSQQETIIKACHDVKSAGHFGKKKSLARVQSRFYWPQMEMHISLYIDACVMCIKKSQKNKRPRSPLIPYYGKAPNDIVSLDILENLPVTKDRYKSILVLVDKYTGWCEAVPLRETKTEHIARVILDNWICAHGVPNQIVSDRGPALHITEIIRAVYALMNINKTATCSYHPQCNGSSERLIRTIKSLLWAYCQENSKNWATCLQQVLFAYRTSQHAATGYSPFFLHRGHKARLPLDIIFNTHTQKYFDSHGEYGYFLFKTLRDTYSFVDKHLKSNREFMKTHYDKRQNLTEYKPGDYVYVWRPRPAGNKNKFFDHFFGPYRVISKHTDSYSYKLDIGTSSRMYDIVPHDLLRKAPDIVEVSTESRDYDNYVHEDPIDTQSNDDIEEQLSGDNFLDHQSSSSDEEGQVIYRNLDPPPLRRSARNNRQTEHFQAGF